MGKLLPGTDGVLDHRGRRRVVVTGLGVISCVGKTVDEFWESLINGRSGIGRMTLIDPTGYPCQIAGEVKNFDPKDYIDGREVKRMARFTQFAVAAARQAIEAAGLNLEKVDRTRVGVLLGNGNGAFDVIDREARVMLTRGGMRITPAFVPLILPNMAASQVSIVFGLKGYNATVVTACAASTHAIGEAVEVIRRGAADVILAGGTEAGISEFGLAAFCVLRALSTQNEHPEKASRPFDARRDGFVPAEGAAVLVVEALDHALRRDAPILAEIAGYGVSADAYHLVAPDPEADGEVRVMRAALEDAGLTPDDVDYINAHATSTPLGDVAETVAIKKVFGERAYSIPVSATKSMVGHALGGAGALEAVACVKTITDGIIHPTINLEYPDPECDLDYVPNVARRADVRVALSNSFGFGGQNACLVFKRFDGV